MKKTVAKITHKGTYRVVYDDSTRYNPYTIYREWYNRGKRTNKIASFSDFASCMYRITEEIVNA